MLQEEVQFVKSLFMDERGCWSALMLPKKAPEWFLGFSHEVKVRLLRWFTGVGYTGCGEFAFVEMSAPHLLPT